MYRNAKVAVSSLLGGSRLIFIFIFIFIFRGNNILITIIL